MDCYNCKFWEYWNDDADGYYGYCRNSAVEWVDSKRYEENEGCDQKEAQGNDVQLPVNLDCIRRKDELMALWSQLEEQNTRLNNAVAARKQLTEEELKEIEKVAFTFFRVTSTEELVKELREKIYPMHLRFSLIVKQDLEPEVGEALASNWLAVFRLCFHYLRWDNGAALANYQVTQSL